MKTKFIAIALMAVLCIGALAGCGSSSSSNNSSNNSSNKANTTQTTNTTANNASTSSTACTDATWNSFQTKLSTLTDLANRVGDKYVNDDSIAKDSDFEAAHNQLADIVNQANSLKQSDCTESDVQSMNASLDTIIAAYQKAATALGV